MTSLSVQPSVVSLWNSFMLSSRVMNFLVKILKTDVRPVIFAFMRSSASRVHRT